MIVCWAVFGITIAVMFVVWNAFDSAASQATAIAESFDRHPAIVSDVVDEDYASIKDENGNTTRDLLRQQKWAAVDRNRKSATAGKLSLFAICILVWNTIWHIGHWIWMGRKAR